MKGYIFLYIHIKHIGIDNIALKYLQTDDLTPRSLVLSDESCDSPSIKPRAGKIKLAPIKGPVPNVKGLIQFTHRNTSS